MPVYAEGQECGQERPDVQKACGRAEEVERRIWVDLLVEELQIFAGIEANDDLHTSCPLHPPALNIAFCDSLEFKCNPEKEEARN